MAQVEIQHKRSNGWIWWVIGIIIVAAIIWWIVAANTDADTVDTTAITPAGAVVAQGVLRGVTTLVDASSGAALGVSALPI